MPYARLIPSIVESPRMGMNWGGEQKIAKGLAFGCGLLLVGFLGFIFLGGFGTLAFAGGLRGGANTIAIAVVFMLMGLIGLFMILYQLIAGLRIATQDDTKMAIELFRGAYVIAKIVTHESGDPVFGWEEYDPDELKWYVTFQFSGGRKMELKTPYALWHQIGEGMSGSVTVQGRTLTSWTPEIKKDDRSNGSDIPPDPFATGQL